MQKIFIVQADHPYVGGRPLTAHVTEPLANNWAAGLVNDIIRDCNQCYGTENGGAAITEPAWIPVPADAVAENWKEKMLALHAEFVRAGMFEDIEASEQNCDVWIMPVDLQDEPPVLQSGANDLATRARVAALRDMENWTVATMCTWADANGVTFDIDARMSVMRRTIIETMDKTGDWVALCESRGVPISPVQA